MPIHSRRVLARCATPLLLCATGLLSLNVHAESNSLEPTLESIQEQVFNASCTQCHAGSNAPRGLSLEAGQARGNLVGVASREVPELMRVEPGNPDDSYLIQKLEGTQDVGRQMPLAGSPLEQQQIDVIRRWIESL